MKNLFRSLSVMGLVTLALASAGCASTATSSSPATPPDLETIQSVVVRVTHAIDRKAWTELRALYGDEVETDYTSLFGGTPQRQSADALIQGWQQALARVSTQHLLGPIDGQVSGSHAQAECHVRAWHFVKGAPGGDEWVVGGHYVFTLTRDGDGAWKISKMKLETLQQTGNRSLLQEASGMR